MKKEFICLIIILVAMIFPLTSAACDLSVSLLNQDPYPAVPGDYVKAVFQINGTEETDCKDVFINLLPEYPFSFDAGEKGSFSMKGGNYLSGYPSFIMAGFKLRVDKDALDGDNKIKVEYGYNSDSGSATMTKDFYINVKDARTDFDVMIQDYSKSSNTITFGIVNTGKNNAESLVFEVPFQDNIKLKGSSNIIIGSLNSNDDTTVTIKGVPKEGEILVKLSYNDANNVRRVVEKKVQFVETLNGDNVAKPYRGVYFYLFWIIFAMAIIYFGYGYYKKRKDRDDKILMIKKR